MHKALLETGAAEGERATETKGQRLETAGRVLRTLHERAEMVGRTGPQGPGKALSRKGTEVPLGTEAHTMYTD